MLTRLFSFALLTCVMLFTKSAVAGCGALCDVVVGSIAVDPPLTCLTVSAEGGDCPCRVDVSFVNGCFTPLDFEPTELDSCDGTSDCSVLAPSASGLESFYPKQDGPTPLVFEFTTSGAKRTVTVNADVSNFDDLSCACRVGGAGSRGGGRGAIFLATGVLLLALIRRSRVCSSQA